MTLVLELPKELQEEIERRAMLDSLSPSQVAIELLAQATKMAPKPKYLQSHGMLARYKNGPSSANITRDRREEVMRELGEIE